MNQESSQNTYTEEKINNMLKAYNSLAKVAIVWGIIEIVVVIALLLVGDTFSELESSYGMGWTVFGFILTFFIISSSSITQIIAGVLGLKVKSNPHAIKSSWILYIVSFLILVILTVSGAGLSIGIVTLVFYLTAIIRGYQILKWVKLGMPRYQATPEYMSPEYMPPENTSLDNMPLGDLPEDKMYSGNDL